MRKACGQRVSSQYPVSSKNGKWITCLRSWRYPVSSSAPLIAQQIPTVPGYRPRDRKHNFVSTPGILFHLAHCLTFTNELWSNVWTAVVIRSSTVVPFLLCPLFPMSFETRLTYIVLLSSWCRLRGDQPESGLCTRGHHADFSRDHPGWPGPASAGGAREVWTGTTDAHEWDPRGAKQGYHPHQWLSFWLWVKILDAIKIYSNGYAHMMFTLYFWCRFMGVIMFL